MVSIDYGKLDWSLCMTFSRPLFLAATRNGGAFFIWLFLSVIYDTDRLHTSQEKLKSYKKLFYFSPRFLSELHSPRFHRKKAQNFTRYSSPFPTKM